MQLFSLSRSTYFCNVCDFDADVLFRDQEREVIFILADERLDFPIYMGKNGQSYGHDSQRKNKDIKNSS